MRKRLIEKFTKSKEGSLGYTLTELLVVIGIIALVCAIAIPSVIAISKALRFKQRNDYAKSIFMAAQQNLTEMRSDGGLVPLQGTEEEVNSEAVPKGRCGFPDEEWSDEYVYTASNLGVVDEQRNTYDLVLPVGSIESVIRDKQVIIEYNPITGNVYAVFYSEEDDQDILAAYEAGTLPREDANVRKDLMLGYYCGSGLSSNEIELEKTVAEVEFTNGQEGIVTVKIPMPSLYYGKHDKFIEGLKIDLTVSGDISSRDFTVNIKQSGVITENCELDVDGKTVLVTYVLDSLADYRSFANLATGTTNMPAAGTTNTPAAGSGVSLLANTNARRVSELLAADFMDASGKEKAILPGENITILADVSFERSGSNPAVSIEDGILAGVNPMFEYLDNSGTSDGEYTLAVSNGRNLQNLNALHPAIAEDVEAVIFTDDIHWEDTVAYYNKEYGSSSGSGSTGEEEEGEEESSTPTESEPAEDTTVVRSYSNNVAEAPARALPYFVPIHNEKLFGTAYFTMDNGHYTSILEIIKDFFNGTLGQARTGVPVLTDAYDMRKVDGKTIASGYATIHGNKHRVYNINIDTTKYCTGKAYYAGNANADIDRFTGLFGYVNTAINDLYVVNPIVKGYYLTIDANKKPNNNPATGALLGAGGFNTQIRNSGVYLEDIDWAKADLQDYAASGDQTWYGVSGEGAVGGLVGYSKSHRTVDGNYKKGDDKYLAFSNCFAAVGVSGNMRTSSNAYDFGYSNGIGGFIGNSQLTNFYNCYASGNVRGKNAARVDIYDDDDGLPKYLGLYADGRSSYGIGGFVGTSHGTRYTNCFSTGAARNASGSASVGGFVGVMCYDETFAYGLNQVSSTNVAQHTVFENCYALGAGKDSNFKEVEGFSGTNARIDLSYSNIKAYYVADYYRLLAPYYIDHRNAATAAGKLPNYQTHYIFKDSYYLQRTGVSNSQSNHCASPIQYSDLEKLMPREGSKLLASLKTQTLDGQVAFTVVKVLLGDDAGLRILVELLGEAIYDILFKGGQEAVSYEVYFKLADKLTPSIKSDLENAYINAYKEAFTTGWVSEAIKTHYYGYGHGKVYPFPMIKDMDYYGDWPTEPLSAGIAYFEEYATADGNVYGYYLDRQDTSNLRNDGANAIISDGYAIMTGSATTPEIKLVKADDSKVTLTPVNKGTVNLSNAEGQNKQAYTAWHLDMAAVAAAVTDTAGMYGDNFYVKLEVKVGSEEFNLYMNPNVAIGHVNTSGFNGAAPSSAIIRTARQFAALGTMDSFWNLSYAQQLNIHAPSYYEGENETIPTLKPIGTAAAPFTGSYNGKSGYVEMAELTGFAPATSADTTGYFGVIGEEGSVSNLTLKMGAATVSNTKNAGILAGVNNGTISNVKLAITASETGVGMTATENAGLLVGKTSGTLASCVVTADGLVNLVVPESAGNTEATVMGNAGGLVGYAENAEILDSKVSLKVGFTGIGVNLGGVVGYAKNCEIQNVAVSGVERQDLYNTSMNVKATAAGGFAGAVTGGKVTTVDVTLTQLNSNNNGYMGGAIGQAENGTYVDVSTVIANACTLSGDTAAGVFGSADGVTVRASDARITGTVHGTTNAAGFAGIVGDSDQLIESTYVTINPGVITNTIPQNGTKPISGRAAGFAVVFGGQTNGVGVKLGAYGENNTPKPNEKGVIQGGTEAAGFACSVTGQVNSGTVMGSGTISAGADTGKAAGFALTLSGNRGRISGSYVTPAMGDQPGNYLGNSNDNLTVSGSSAAGFVLDVQSDKTADTAGIDGSYVLCKVIGANAYGFAGTNTGRISESMANVTIPAGGYAFTGNNSGLVINSYGWFGDGDQDIKNNKYPGSEAETGTYTSSYFVDININEGVASGAKTAVLFDNKSAKHDMLPSEVQGALELLNPSDTNAVKEWRAGGTQDSRPYYDQYDGGYPYPELRSHYGNWLIPPQYAYGVAYYEKYVSADGTENLSLHIVDLSTPPAAAKVEDYKFSREDALGSGGTIGEAGYLLFCKEGTNPFTDKSLLGDKSDISTEKLVEKALDKTKSLYSFYKFAKDGAFSISGTKGETAKVVTYYADAIDLAENEPYNIRTADQLANVKEMSAASFKQSHKISGDGFTVIDSFTGSYDGDGYNIAMAKGTAWMTSVGGTVENVDLDITGDVTEAIFGTIAEEKCVALTDLDIGGGITEGAVVDTLTGSFECPTVSVAGNVDTKMFGEVSGTLNGGQNEQVTPMAITVSGTVNGSLIDTVSGGTTTLGAFSTGDLPGYVIQTVSGGSVVTGNIETGDIAADKAIFGSISGVVTTGTITTDCVNGKLIGSVGGGTVTLGNITVDSSYTANEAVEGSDETQAVTKYADVPALFGTISDGTVTGKTADTTIGLGAANIGNVFSGVTGGALKNFNVTTTGSMSESLIGGTLGGALDNVDVTTGAGMSFSKRGLLVDSMANAGVIQNCDVTIHGTVTVNAADLEGITVEDLAVKPFGGIVGMIPAGVTLTNNTVDYTMTFNGADNTLSVVGGLVGVNGGAISGGSADAEITYVQTSGGADIDDDQVGIGGLAGWMLSGSSVSGTAEGKIQVSGALNLTGTGEGRDMYFAGGAVGYDGGATYAYVESSVRVADSWGGIALTNPNVPAAVVSPSGEGAVGKFVGYVTSGKFTNCSGMDTTTDYQFLGEIAVNDPKTAASGTYWSMLSQNGFTNPVDSEVLASEDASAIYSDFIASEEEQYYSYQTSMTVADNCRYSDTEGVYYQLIEETRYLYEKNAENTSKVKDYAATALTAKRSEGVSKTYSDWRTTLWDSTTAYYCEISGKYYRVAEINVDGSWREGWTYTAKYYDENNKEVSLPSTQDGNAPLTFYTFSAAPVANKEYLIVSNGVAMTATGSAIGATNVTISDGKIKFTSNEELNKGRWLYNSSFASIDNKYINLTAKDNGWYGTSYSLSLGNGQNITSNAIIANGSANGAIALFDFSVKSGSGWDTKTTYLSFNNGSFNASGSSSHAFALYEVEAGNLVERTNFMYKDTDWHVASTAVNGQAKSNAATEVVSDSKQEELPTETTTPTSETTGGETQNPTE